MQLRDVWYGKVERLRMENWIQVAQIHLQEPL